MDVFGCGVPCRNQEAHVGVARLVQGGGHADDRRVALCERRVVRSHREGWLDTSKPLRGDILHVGLPALQSGHLAWVHVDPNHREAPFREGDREGQAHVTQAHHGHHGLTFLYLLQ